MLLLILGCLQFAASKVSKETIVNADNVTVILKNFPSSTFSYYRNAYDVDSSVPPGKSFFHYANNPWISKNPIPENKVLYWSLILDGLEYIPSSY
jgi:hypothetical protein